jgi:hypothetical protein
VGFGLRRLDAALARDMRKKGIVIESSIIDDANFVDEQFMEAMGLG